MGVQVSVPTTHQALHRAVLVVLFGRQEIDRLRADRRSLLRRGSAQTGTIRASASATIPTITDARGRRDAIASAGPVHAEPAPR
jgi:hypothetical protein